MKCLIVLSLVVLATVLIEPVVSSCYNGMINLNIDDKGNIDQYCDGPSGRMEVGESERQNCVDCSCSTHGLQCCGVGYKAGAMSVEDCEIKKETDTCCYQFFKTNNPTEACGDKKCPDDN